MQIFSCLRFDEAVFDRRQSIFRELRSAMNKKNFLAGVLAGFVGGLLGAYVLGHVDSILVSRASAAVATQELVLANRIRLLDSNGKARAELAMSADGGPALFFYDTHGKNRLVLGLYSPAEREYPFVVLNDTNQLAAGIFRLFGARETPVVVLKNKGQDRSIYGLNFDSTQPFLVNIAPDGKKSALFGSF